MLQNNPKGYGWIPCTLLSQGPGTPQFTICISPLTSARINELKGQLRILCLISKKCCSTSLLAFKLLNLVIPIKSSPWGRLLPPFDSQVLFVALNSQPCGLCGYSWTPTSTRRRLSIPPQAVNGKQEFKFWIAWALSFYALSLEDFICNYTNSPKSPQQSRLLQHNPTVPDIRLHAVEIQESKS